MRCLGWEVRGFPMFLLVLGSVRRDGWMLWVGSGIGSLFWVGVWVFGGWY